MNPMPRPRLNSSPFRCCRAVMSLAVLLAAAFCARGAPAGAGDAPVQKRIEAILERRQSFKTEEAARPTLKELDDASNNPNLERELRYRASRASYRIKSYLFLYEEALKSARIGLELATTEEERAESALAIAQTLLRRPKIAKDEQEIRTACENAFVALNEYIEFGEKGIPVPKTMQGKTIKVIPDPYRYIFDHINLLNWFSKHLSSINDHEGAWEKSKETLTMFHVYSDQLTNQFSGSLPPNFVDSLQFQHFKNSIAAGNYHAAATLVLWAFNHETLSEKTAVGMLKNLAQQMVKAEKLTAADVFPSELSLKTDPMIAFLFQSTVAEEFYSQGKYLDAIELTKQNLEYVSKRMMEAVNDNSKELLEEMQKTQYEMLELLNASYVKTGNHDAAISIGRVMQTIQANSKNNPSNEKNDRR